MDKLDSNAAKPNFTSFTQLYEDRCYAHSRPRLLSFVELNLARPVVCTDVAHICQSAQFAKWLMFGLGSGLCQKFATCSGSGPINQLSFIGERA